MAPILNPANLNRALPTLSPPTKHHPHRSYSLLQIANRKSQTISTIPSPPPVCENSPPEHSPPEHSHMVLPLRPARFYGSSLPRPRIYTDVKLNDSRVDPPTPVMDSFISWAQQAHWSMGGLSNKRLHLQGRIEGSADKIRKMREKLGVEQEAKRKNERSRRLKLEADLKKRSGSVSPPGAPKADKRKRKYAQVIEEEDGEEVAVVGAKRKALARKLVGEFDQVVKESEVRMKTRRKGVDDSVMKVVAEVNREQGSVEQKTVEKKGKKSGSGKVRTSPRLTRERS